MTSSISRLASTSTASTFSSTASSSTASSRKSEIEVADFDRLLSKIEFVRMSRPLRNMLISIKESGGGGNDEASSATERGSSSSEMARLKSR